MALKPVTSYAEIPFYTELEFCSKVPVTNSSSDEEDECEGQVCFGQFKNRFGTSFAVLPELQSVFFLVNSGSV